MVQLRTFTQEQAAQGYNNEGRGRLLGYISDPREHEKTCPYYKNKKLLCACRVGLWQEDKSKKKVRLVARSAITGKFVALVYARRYPKRCVIHKVCID